MVGLFFLALPGFVEFGKLVYERSAGDLPKGQGWLKIDGYVNSQEFDSVKTTKAEEINTIAYGVPLVLGGLMLAFGRLTAGAAPRASGAKGLFAFSGLFTLLGLASLVTFVVCVKLKFEQVAGYTLLGFLIVWGLAEVWFLTGLATAGAHLKRPGVARSVGFLWFVAALLAVASTVGWEQYVKEVRPKPAKKEVDKDAKMEPDKESLVFTVKLLTQGKPFLAVDNEVVKEVDKDSLLYESGAQMLGWLLLIGCYWRTVRSTRAAIRDFTDSVE